MNEAAWHKASRSRQWWRPLRSPGGWLVMMVCAAAMLGGCETFGWIAKGMQEREPAVYRIADRTTAVLVDDPSGLLGDPSNRGVVASRIHFELTHNEAVRTVINPSEVQAMERRIGSAFATTPTDVIGRELGAEQVVTVEIESAELVSTPGTLRPRILARVKLIDVTERTRLFPPMFEDFPDDPTAAARGHLVVAELRERSPLNESRADEAILRRQLSDRLGRDVARLFFRYVPRQPGEPFED